MTGTGPDLAAAVVETGAVPLLLCFTAALEGGGFFPKAAALDDDELDDDVLEDVEVGAFLRFKISFSGSTETTLTGFVAVELSERVLVLRSLVCTGGLGVLLAETARPCSVRSL